MNRADDIRKARMVLVDNLEPKLFAIKLPDEAESELLGAIPPDVPESAFPAILKLAAEAYEWGHYDGRTEIFETTRERLSSVNDALFKIEEMLWALEDKET